VNRVGITGLGTISALGNSPEEFFAALVAARSGARRAQELATGGAPPVVAAAEFDADSVTSRVRGHLDRATAFGLDAARQAVADAGGGLETASSRTGVYWGTGAGGVGTIESNYRRIFSENNWRVNPATVVTAMNNAAAAHIALEFGVTGPTLTYTIACASAAIALGEAMRAIRFGIVDRAIVGGADAVLTRGTLAAWTAMRTLAREDPRDPARSCKPFAFDRSGFVLGEGSGALVLEEAGGARQRGARIYAEFAGYASTSDASHVSDPSSDGQSRAMMEAMLDAGVEAADIGYVNAHGTATMQGDRVEVESIRRAFGPRATSVPVSSTKALHGHCMGATGAMEFIAAILALHQKVIPPTAHLDVVDPGLDLDLVPNHARPDETLRAVMSNSFAFGGANAVLVATAPSMNL
jgi:3-oxoacyl-[acyl-carrier-protein] synthase II